MNHYTDDPEEEADHFLKMEEEERDCKPSPFYDDDDDEDEIGYAEEFGVDPEDVLYDEP